MIDIVIVVGFLVLGLTALFAWAFRHLPGEKWQIIATFPRQRKPDGTWRGVNLTYYGLFNALGIAAAVMVSVFLAGAAELPLTHMAVALVAILAVCLPASKIINRLVEGHWHGFTVGGASFAGIIIGPWLAAGIAHLGQKAGGSQEAVNILAIMAIAYALGEGIGRLACISFGCCYGRPLTDFPNWLQKTFSHWTFVFEGRMKKSSYAGGFEGRHLIPVQGMTAIISSAASLVGMALFLGGFPLPGCVIPIMATQVWRFFSEFLRADYRGTGRISAYQWMALAGGTYSLAFCLLWPDAPRLTTSVAQGLALLWTPGAMLLIASLAVFVFIRMGVSTVTTAHITFNLQNEMILK